MNFQALLNDVLSSGKEMASKGQSYAENKLNIPQEEGKERDAAMSGLKTGAAAAGVLALLLGTSTGRQVSGQALKLGSLAAVGGLAWKAYQNWSNKQEGEQAQQAPALSVDRLEGDQANERSIILLKAMIAAAKADGHIDEKEKALMETQITKMGLEDGLANTLQSELMAPLSIDDIAQMAEGNKEIASEIYLVSSIVATKDNIDEALYLKNLATALALPDDLVAELEAAQANA